MKKFLQKRMKNEKGLTLVELLAVIVILGIIAAIAVPSIGNIIENSRVKAIQADGQMILSAGDMYFTENPPSGTTTSVSIKDLKDEGFLDDYGSFKDVAESATGVTYNKDGNTLTANGKNGSATLTLTAATKTGLSQKAKSGATINGDAVSE